MSSSEGLKRGMHVTATGAPISVPVGEGVLGRIFNVTGDPVDERGPVHLRRSATRFIAPRRRSSIRTPRPTILETGIKVIDLICPFTKGGKVGAFGGAGVGKTVVISNSSTTSPRSTAASPSSPAWASVPAKATIFTMK